MPGVITAAGSGAPALEQRCRLGMPPSTGARHAVPGTSPRGDLPTRLVPAPLTLRPPPPRPRRRPVGEPGRGPLPRAPVRASPAQHFHRSSWCSPAVPRFQASRSSVSCPLTYRRSRCRSSPTWPPRPGVDPSTPVVIFNGTASALQRGLPSPPKAPTAPAAGAPLIGTGAPLCDSSPRWGRAVAPL